MWENVRSDMCAQRRLKSACAFAQSDQSSLSAWRNFASLAIQNASSEDSDQTARMRRLIWIFAGRTCPKLRFLTLRPIHFALNFERWQMTYVYYFFQENRPWHLMWVARRFTWNVNPICTCGDNSRGIQNLISWENRFQTISGNVKPYLSMEMVSRAARQFIWNVSPYCGDNLRQMLRPTSYFLKK